MAKGNTVKKHERKMQRKAERKSEKMYEKEHPRKREKYGNKTGPARIFHKYTGVIVVLTAILIIFLAWLYHDSTLEEFEKFTCSQVEQYEGLKGLTDDQMVKWNNIVADCKGKFTPP